jgi:hypothetical protein
MGAHLREAGKAIVMDPERSKDPVEFVQRLLQVRTLHFLRVPLPSLLLCFCCPFRVLRCRLARKKSRQGLAATMASSA